MPPLTGLNPLLMVFYKDAAPTALLAKAPWSNPGKSDQIRPAYAKATARQAKSDLKLDRETSLAEQRLGAPAYWAFGR
jgi:hypothetical protein